MMTTVVDKPDWRRSACQGMTRDLFFPDDFQLPDQRAIETCARCEIREACATYAIETDQEFGIWGGLTEAARRKIDVARSRVRCPGCRADNVLLDPPYEICLNCGLSWQV